jgi:hypothetical protein
MATKTLTKDQIAEIQATLALAREGRATLVQLATAHDLAIGAVLNGCLGELRAHIFQMVAPPRYHMEGKDIMLGVASGFLTHFLLQENIQKREGSA